MSELIKGLEILSIEKYYAPTLLTLAIAVLFFILVVIIDVFWLNANGNMAVLSFAVVCIFIVITIMCPMENLGLSKCTRIEYECYIHEDKMDYKEFYEKCKVVKSDGKSCVVELKDNQDED